MLGNPTLVCASKVIWTALLCTYPSAGRSDKLPRLQLTAALLQDSGWYLPRAAAMPPLDFGAGAGCGWLAASAGAWVAGRPGQQLYCDVQEGASAVNGERQSVCAVAGKQRQQQPSMDFQTCLPGCWGSDNAGSSMAPCIVALDTSLLRR
jgi:hypothetical protein